MRQGEDGDCMYIVLHGRLRATARQEDGKMLEVGEIGPGECVGEMSILAKEKRTASVHTIRDTELLRISKEGADRLIEKHPAAMVKVARILVSRLKQTIQTSRSVHSVTAISIFPASENVPLSKFSEKLEMELSVYGSTFILNGQNWKEVLTDRTAPSSGPKNNEDAFNLIGERYKAIESQYRYIIFESETDWSYWTKLCARQADLIFLVGMGASEPVEKELVNRLFVHDERQLTPKKSLVLLHPNKSQKPTGTRKWLSKMDLDAHYHICLDSKADFQRLARFLTGNAVGLVLGGGGARGLAHIGAVRALQEEGVSIDFIGATSMGTVIGSQLAMGWDWKRMEEENRRIFMKSGRLHDFTIPVISLLEGQRFNRVFLPIYKDLLIEDLYYNFFCVSFNLTRAEPVVHRSGPLATAIKASCAVPGIFPPVLYDGELLVDGGVYNNLPVEIMNERLDGTIIGIDVSPTIDMRAQADQNGNFHYHSWGGSPSPMRVLLDMLNPFKKRDAFPTITDILLRTVNAQSIRMIKEQKKYISLYLCPPVGQLGHSEWKKFDQFVETGYRYTKEKLLAEKPKSVDESPNKI